MNDTIDASKPAARRGAGGVLRRLMLGAALAGSFVVGGLAMSGTPASALTLAMEEGMGGHGGMHAMARAHFEKMLTQVDASPEQKAKIDAIVKAAFQSMAPLHQRMESTHRDLHQLLAAPSLDRAALENLRAARMADLDQASKTMVQAMADAAEVLTPEQRAKMARLMAEQRHHSM